MGASRSEGTGFLLQDLWGLALVLVIVIGFGLVVAASWFVDRRH